MNRAGWLLAQNGIAADPLVIGHALDVVNDWRSSHSFPLNTFQMTLRYHSYHSGRTAEYNGLQVELQLRTRLQHAWATAVETVGTFLGQALKSSEGERNWLRFFELVGSVFALHERIPAGPGTPADRAALVADTRKAEQRLQATDRFVMFRDALHVIGENPAMRQGAYFLLVIEPDRRRLTVRSCRRRELAAGIQQYQEEEKRIAGTTGDAVLVAADSLSSLRRAYPNYFGDTQTFVEEMTRLLV